MAMVTTLYYTKVTSDITFRSLQRADKWTFHSVGPKLEVGVWFVASRSSTQLINDASFLIYVETSYFTNFFLKRHN